MISICNPETRAGRKYICVVVSFDYVEVKQPQIIMARSSTEAGVKMFLEYFGKAIDSSIFNKYDFSKTLSEQEASEIKNIIDEKMKPAETEILVINCEDLVDARACDFCRKAHQ